MEHTVPNVTNMIKEAIQQRKRMTMNSEFREECIVLT